MRAAAILGLAGATLTAAEHALLRAARPAGLILFARNCIDPAQVERLVGEAVAAIGDSDVLVLIDQEGGRVRRLKPPHWRVLPPAAAYRGLYAVDPAAGAAGGAAGGPPHGCRSAGARHQHQLCARARSRDRRCARHHRRPRLRRDTGRRRRARPGRGGRLSGRRRGAGDQAHSRPRACARRQPSRAAGRATPAAPSWRPPISPVSARSPTCRRR